MMVGVGQKRFRSRANYGRYEMIFEAVRGAMDKAGLKKKDITTVISCTNDYYDGRSGPEKIQKPGESDQEAYTLLRKVAGRLNRWATQSSEGGAPWSTHQVDGQINLANEIYAFLGKKGK